MVRCTVIDKSMRTHYGDTIHLEMDVAAKLAKKGWLTIGENVEREEIVSLPPPGYCTVDNIYVDPITKKLVIKYNDTVIV
jgi:hypothetical protein